MILGMRWRTEPTCPTD